MTDSTRFRFATLALHAGYTPEPLSGARAVPIYATASYEFRDAAHAAALFDLKEAGHIYTRIGNPTTGVFEARMAALEGGVAAVATASGQSAIAGTILTLLKAGDELVSSTSLYGGTFNLFKLTLARTGIRTHFVDHTDLDAVRAAITPSCRALFVESLGNPQLDIPDIEALAAVAHNAGLPLIVDNTVATPALLRPFEHGADIVVSSATKYLGGHGQALGGIIVDGGTFPWGAGGFPEFTEPHPGYQGIRLAEAFGPSAFAAKVRLDMLRDLGPALAPHNAHALLTGLETLLLRMTRHSENALAVARFLADRPEVAWVRYPGLENDPYHTRARRYLRGGFGGIVTFGLRGGLAAGRRFVNHVELFSLLANIGDTRTLVIHPASTTHQQLTPDERRASGVTDDLVRLSVGIEDREDILGELTRLLALS